MSPASSHIHLLEHGRDRRTGAAPGEELSARGRRVPGRVRLGPCRVVDQRVAVRVNPLLYLRHSPHLNGMQRCPIPTPTVCNAHRSSAVQPLGGACTPQQPSTATSSIALPTMPKHKIGLLSGHSMFSSCHQDSVMFSYSVIFSSPCFDPNTIKLDSQTPELRTA